MVAHKELLPGDRIGNYILERKLGEGGWGEVWLARHAELANKPRVAIKFVLRPRPSELDRFKREVAILDQLRDNRHTINAEDYGQQDGIPYLVMEYASGGDLARRIGQRIPLETIADYLVQAADGLDYSHRRNIIHRDLKPNNILFAGDETLRLADFGIAHEDDDYHLTMTGSSLGTPEYMPPEQFINAKEAGPAADIYSLGVICFQLIAGRLPFGSRRDGRSTGEILIAHREAPVPQLKQFNPQVPPTLQAIVEKALAKNPAWRYRTAGEFASAFRQAVRPPAPPPLPTESYTGSGPLTGTGSYTYNAPPGPGVRPTGPIPATPGRVEQRPPVMVNPPPARPPVVVTPPPVQPPVRVNPPVKANVKKGGSGWGCLVAFLIVMVLVGVIAANWDSVSRTVNNITGPVIGQKPERSLLGFSGSVNAIAFSPNSQILATATSNGKINLFNPNSASSVASFQAGSNTAEAVAFSPDGRTLATASSDGSLKLWDTTNLNKALASFNLTSGGDAFAYALYLAYSKDGKMLGVVDANGKVQIFDANVTRLIASFSTNEPSVNYTALAFSPDNVTIALGNDYRDVSFFDIATQKFLGEVNNNRATYVVNGLAFSPDGSKIASATGDKLARLWNVPFNQQPGAQTPLGTNSCSIQTIGNGGIPTCPGLAVFSGHEGAVKSVAFSPNGKLLATGSIDKVVKLWDATSFNSPKSSGDLPGGKEQKSFYGHTGAVNLVAFSPDGKLLASASEDGSVKIWKLT